MPNVELVLIRQHQRRIDGALFATDCGGRTEHFEAKSHDRVVCHPQLRQGFRVSQYFLGRRRAKQRQWAGRERNRIAVRH